MADDEPIYVLKDQLRSLRAARATGARSIQFSDRTVEYKSDIEMRLAIEDLERRIDGTASRSRTVRIATSKGLRD